MKWAGKSAIAPVWAAVFRNSRRSNLGFASFASKVAVIFIWGSGLRKVVIGRKKSLLLNKSTSNSGSQVQLAAAGLAQDSAIISHHVASRKPKWVEAQRGNFELVLSCINKWNYSESWKGGASAPPFYRPITHANKDAYFCH